MTPPFDAERLDALLDEAGADAVVATSSNNVFYLVGSYSAFFASFDAIGVDRFLPAVAIRRGRLADAFAVGHDVDRGLHEVASVRVLPGRRRHELQPRAVGAALGGGRSLARLRWTASRLLPATHRDRPLEAGMVLSIETDLHLEWVGLIKLEDTVAVTADGCDGYGDAHRDWIVA